MLAQTMLGLLAGGQGPASQAQDTPACLTGAGEPGNN